MIVTGNFKMALESIRTSKTRSLLTMLGIVIGVASVVTIVSIGEGVKAQVSSQISNLGSDLITVQPGPRQIEGQQKTLSGLIGQRTTGSLSEADLETIKNTSGVSKVAPINIVSGIASVRSKEYSNVSIVSSLPALTSILGLKVEYGAFFSEQEANRDVAVIGQDVAEKLFGSTAPTGQSLQIRGRSFVVVGVLEKSQSTPLSSVDDFRNTIIIPLNSSKNINDGQLNISQIFAKPTTPDQAKSVIYDITKRLKEAHSGQEDFSVYSQTDMLATSNKILELLTALVTGVAGISLLVGGIGIMNVMLVSVAERTREIGVRKSIGASNQQILMQFTIESAMVSFVGGIFGILLAFLANFVLRITTDVEPMTTLLIIGTALVVSLIIGIVFGLAPAVKAARKNPIDALRTNI